jgi:hypothetical protein
MNREQSRALGILLGKAKGAKKRRENCERVAKPDNWFASTNPPSVATYCLILGLG